jgi:ferritin-like metal-binding protein YciE
LDELFHDTLKDIYFAEKKILATLPKMAKAAQSTDLKKAFEKHRGETEGHVTRLENAIVGHRRGRGNHERIQGLAGPRCGLVGCGAGVEHYEILRVP